YPGIDVVYYGNDQQQLEYDFVVAPGADVGQIGLRFTGAQSLEANGTGDLVLHTPGGNVVQRAPVVYQDEDGVREAVSGHFVLDGSGQVGFAVGPHDPGQALVIDPVLSYSTYLGGSGGAGAHGIAVDSTGKAYVTGGAGLNFPLANAVGIFGSYGGGTSDAFV